jgi:cysteine desulfurase
MKTENRNIYLDFNATTYIDPLVVEAMAPYFTDHFGNPSSIHQFGQSARKAMDNSRETLADLLSCDPMEIVFTSGGTEANNTAVIGAALANRNRGNHVIASAVEHHCVLNACQVLIAAGFDVTLLPVDHLGRVRLSDVENAIRNDTVLISVMHANNETGTIQPIAEIAALAREKGILFHTDAVQAGGKLPVNVTELGMDLLGLSAHKFYGPKGVGLLYSRSGVRFSPLLVGGSQERSRRAGTSNVAGIVGLSKAYALAGEMLSAERIRLTSLRDEFRTLVKTRIQDVHCSTGDAQCLPNTLHICFPFVESEAILLNLDIMGIAASSGSACASGNLEPSHVLSAMGLPVDYSQGGIRFSLGRSTTREHLHRAVDVLADVIARLRAMSPRWERYRKGEIEPYRP